MQRKIVIGNTEYAMPKMGIDDYMEYLDLSEKMDGHPRFTREDIEAMVLFVCKAYGNQFTEKELKDKEKGLDAAGIIMEFQFIDVGIGEELTRRMEKIEKNFQIGK